MNKPTVETVMDNLNLSSDLDFVKDNLLYLVIAGSHAYGTNRPESDVDIRGVCIKPLNYYLGTKNFEQKEDKTHDITIYELTKFMTLAKGLNPNVLELLFINNPQHVIYIHPIMASLLKHKHQFISKHAQKTFLGYADAQLKRIKNHKKWIDNPLARPNRNGYDLGTNPIMSYDKLQNLNLLSGEDFESLDVNPSTKYYLQQEIQYKHDLEEFKKYDNWVKTRNPARAELERKCGYDSKHAMHLVRLIRMAAEIATEGTIHIDRTPFDVDELNNIREGNISYGKLMKLVDYEEAKVSRLFKESTIPYSVDHQAIDKLLEDVLREFLGLTN